MARSNVVRLPREHKRPKPNRIPRAGRETGYRRVEKDPAMLEVVELLDQSTKSMAAISRETGVSVQTIRNWSTGVTRRPQNVTMDFVLRAIGYERVIRKAKP